MPDTKIFIDTNEELTFLVEKIKTASTQNVVVIVPDRASIFITSASLRLLKKSIDKLDKKVILVTMDEAGKKMAESIDFVTVYRVRDVVPDLWQSVKKYVPVKKSVGVKKNNVIRDLPKDFEDTLKNEDAQVDDPLSNVEENKVIEESEITPEPVLPNIPEEKFEFPNDSQLENTQEESIDEIAEENKIDTKSEEDLEAKEISQSIIENEISYENNIKESVLKSDEETLLKEENIIPSVEIEQTQTSRIINPEKKFVMPHFEKEEDEDDLIFFEGEDIAYKSLKKKSPNLHLREE